MVGWPAEQEEERLLAAGVPQARREGASIGAGRAGGQDVTGDPSRAAALVEGWELAWEQGRSQLLGVPEEIGR